MRIGITNNRRFIEWHCVALLLSLVNPAYAAQIERIVIVKSSENAYFNQTIDTLSRQLVRKVSLRVIMAEAPEADLKQADQKVLYIALGLRAVEAIARLKAPAEVINAYLTQEQYRSLEPGRRQRSVLLDQPLQRYLVFSELMLQPKTIGVITPEPLQLGRVQQRVLKQYQLDLQQYRVDAENKLLPVLRRLLQQNDALLMLPRQSIYNRDTLKGVLLTSYRNRKPVISYSPAHVKSGALASIYSSPVDIGRHLATLVNRRLQARNPLQQTFEFARFYSIATNPRVARALQLTLPDKSELRRQLDGVN